MHEKMMKKKGFTAISVLILFVAITVIAIIVVAFFFKVEYKMVGQSNVIKRNIDRQTKHMQIIEIAGYDARNQYLSKITIDAKLYDDSDNMDLSSISLGLGDSNYKSVLLHRENGDLANNNSGYNTWAPQDFGEVSIGEAKLSFDVDAITEALPYSLPLDLDSDGLTDTIYTCDDSGLCPANYDGTHLLVDLSSESTPSYVELINDDGQAVNISTQPQTLNITKAEISGGHGYISLFGTTSQNYRIGYGGETVTIYKPYEILDSDLDDDKKDDGFYLNSTHLILVMSSIEEEQSFSLGTNISNAPSTLAVNQRIEYNGTNYGTLKIQGTSTIADEIEESVYLNITSAKDQNGYYVTNYLKRGEDAVDGFITKGDIVRFTAEIYRPILINEEIKIDFYYHDSMWSGKTVFTGHTMPARNKLILFPQV